MHVGGRPENAPSPPATGEICAAIGPTLRPAGHVIFVTSTSSATGSPSINVTSPTGIQEIDRFDGISIEALIRDRIEAKRTAQPAA